MIMHQIFEAEPINELFLNKRLAAHRLLLTRGWEPTTVPNEYRHPDAPGYSIDLDMHYITGGPFIVFRGSRKVGQLPYPPYASHLRIMAQKAAKPSGSSSGL